MDNSSIYISRELSWLDFNERVLEEAFAENNPLLERLKFVAIFSSNLDEFFMVRIAGLQHMLAANQDNPDPAGNKPSVLLPMLYNKVSKLQNSQYELLTKNILPQLAKENIELCKISSLTSKQQEQIKEHFEYQILPVLTPVAVDPSHPFPILSNGAIEIAVSIIPAGKDTPVHALVEVPELLPRFIQLEQKDKSEKQQFVLLEDVIMMNLEMLFNGCEIVELLPFRITRDMDMTVNEDGVEDLLQYLEKTLLERRTREPIRLEVAKSDAQELTTWLMSQFELDTEVCYSVNGPLHLKQFFELVSKAKRPDLLEPSWPALQPPELPKNSDIFQNITENSPVMVIMPFQRFDPVVDMLKQAANDPDVLAIKQTLYRVSGNSPVVRMLQHAAENGKQVTVIVELKARFDEGNNIVWAKKLEESGAHVIYGISGLKIHGKALLVVRKEEGKIKRYVHLSTGNYNDKTATLYTDIGFFSDDESLTADVAALFNVMTGYASPGQWNKIAIAPFNMRKRFLELINRETAFAKTGKKGHIVAKMNSLVDPEIIKNLNIAAQAGVKIELVVRGICCMRPTHKNIKIISIVDRFLEHTRVYYFGNNGEGEYYLSSADWMYRNLDRRIEILFPVEDPKLRKQLKWMLKTQLADRKT